VRQISRELGVRYVLEGSVRKASNRVRITGLLVDAANGANLWADRFEGGLDSVFTLQDQLTACVVGAIAPKLEQAEIERAKRKPTESLGAYDYFLRGIACVYRWKREANAEALQLFYRAIQIDPDFASAYGMGARCYCQRKGSGWMIDRVHEAAEAARLATKAAELGKDDAIALGTAGFAFGYVVGDLDAGVALIDRALLLDPNSAIAWHFGGWLRVWLGDHEAAIEHFARAIRLSPQDPHMFNMRAGVSLAHYFAGRNADASAWAEAAAREQPNHVIAACIGAASSAVDERFTEAVKEMVRLRLLEPALSLSNLKDLVPLRRSEDFARLAQGLREAGLPE
jgi:tetratricopeptide (TPR) repeat protein